MNTITAPRTEWWWRSVGCRWFNTVSPSRAKPAKTSAAPAARAQARASGFVAPVSTSS